MPKSGQPISIIPINGIPEIKPKDDLVTIVLESVSDSELSIDSGDVLVFAQKVISKAENRIVDLNNVSPAPYAHTLSKEISKDPRLVEVILSETTKIIKMDQRKPEKGRLIVETRGGVISNNNSSTKR